MIFLLIVHLHARGALFLKEIKNLTARTITSAKKYTVRESMRVRRPKRGPVTSGDLHTPGDGASPTAGMLWGKLDLEHDTGTESIGKSASVRQ